MAWLWVKNSKIYFVVIQHVTITDYRISGELYKAKEAKVILGPVRGALITPKPFNVYEKNQLVANFREFVNKIRAWNPFYKKALRSYYKTYFINYEIQ